MGNYLKSKIKTDDSYDFKASNVRIAATEARIVGKWTNKDMEVPWFLLYWKGSSFIIVEEYSRIKMGDGVVYGSEFFEVLTVAMAKSMYYSQRCSIEFIELDEKGRKKRKKRSRR